MSDIPAKKKLLRKEILDLRNATDAESCSLADARIQAQLEALSDYKSANTVFCYVSVGTEVSTINLIESMIASGKTVCVPLTKGRHTMFAHEIKSLDDLEEGAFGIPAPPAESPLVRPEDIDVVIMPCVTCDRSGVRLGYGGGYYDTYLTSNQKIARIVLCRENLLVDSLPFESHDLRVDIIVTDKEVVMLR